MIVDAIERLLRGETAADDIRIAWAEGVVRGSGLHSFTRNFVRREARDAKRAPVSASSHFYCPRSLYYDLTSATKEPPAPRAFLSFFIGDSVEDMVVGLAVLAGVPVVTPDGTGNQRVVSRIMDGQVVPGHIDMTISYNGQETPVEVKSMSDFGWKKAKDEGVENTFGYLDQLQFYMSALKTSRGFFVGVNKSTGHIFEEEVKADVNAVGAIDLAYAQARLGVIEREAPERPEWATTKRIAGTDQIESTRCGYCGYRDTCWPGYRMTVVGGKPVYRRPVEGSPVEVNRE